MSFNNEYLIKFDNKYTKDNFNIDKPLYFFLGYPKKNDINIRNVCAVSILNSDNIGIYIKDFNINNNAKGRKLSKLLEKEEKSISIYRNIIKKSELYYMTSAFINITIYNLEEFKIISKLEKLNDLSII